MCGLLSLRQPLPFPLSPNNRRLVRNPRIVATKRASHRSLTAVSGPFSIPFVSPAFVMSAPSSSAVPHSSPRLSPTPSLSLSPEAEQQFTALTAHAQQMQTEGLALQNRLAQVEAEKASLAAQLASVQVHKVTVPVQRPPAPKLDQFHGHMNGSVDVFLHNVEKQFTFYGPSVFPSDADKIRFAATYLDGPASFWWTSEDRSQVQTWNQFVHSLHARYRPALPEESARTRLDALRQKGAVSGYTHQFLQLMAYIPDKSENGKIHDYKRGLLPAIAARVAEHQPKTLHEAIDIAVSVEQYVTPRSGQNGHAARVPFVKGHQGSNSASSAMDLNNIMVDGNSGENDEAAPSNSSHSTTQALLAKLEAMQQQLNAIGQTSRVEARRTTKGTIKRKIMCQTSAAMIFSASCRRTAAFVARRSVTASSIRSAASIPIRPKANRPSL